MDDVTVTQADREAACDTYRRFRYGQPPLYTNIAAGRIDHDPIVQAFALHRIAHSATPSPEAAPAAEVQRALRAFVDQASVGKPGTCVTRSKYVSAPASLYHQAVAALSASPRPAVAREEIAALIDPREWEEAESYRVRADEWFAKGRTEPGDCLTDGYRQKANAMQAPLLAKADAIRALIGDARSTLDQVQGDGK